MKAREALELQRVVLVLVVALRLVTRSVVPSRSNTHYHNVDTRRCLYFFNVPSRRCPPQKHDRPNLSRNNAMPMPSTAGMGAFTAAKPVALSEPTSQLTASKTNIPHGSTNFFEFTADPTTVIATTPSLSTAYRIDYIKVTIARSEMSFVSFVGLPHCGSFMITVPLALGRSFEVDMVHDQFLMDGKPFRYISGTMHYFRVPEQYWYDRLLKLKACGLNAVQTLVPWSIHEPEKGKYDFAGRNNVTAFLDTAKELGIYVLISTGPYVCGEIGNGGPPWWLSKIKGIKPRTSEASFINESKIWLRHLHEMLKPYAFKNNGTIIGWQVENELGWAALYSKTCETMYMEILRDEFHHNLGDDVYLYTVDNPKANVKCGSVSGVNPTMNFGTWQDPKQAFDVKRKVAPHGPLAVSEFYPGWASMWGFADTTVHFDIPKLVKTFSELLALNASVNFYMFEGGSNFAYLGAGNGPYENHGFVTQSHDYGALLSENGTPTPKYFAMRKEIEKANGPIQDEVPPAIPAASYGKAKVHYAGSIIDFINQGSHKPVYSDTPLSFDDLDHPYGFVLYETVLASGGKNLTIPKIDDFGYVMLDNTRVGALGLHKGNTLKLTARKDQMLRILVESFGRHQDGFKFFYKGIQSGVALDDQPLLGWCMYPLELDQLLDEKRIESSLNDGAAWKGASFIPSFFVGSFDIKAKAEDTFFDPSGWGQGQFLINGQNVGKYWPDAGPQVTIWVPGPWLREGKNVFVMFELQAPPRNCLEDHQSCAVEFVDAAKRKDASKYR